MIKLNTPADIIPGAAIGKIILKKEVNLDAPSIREASSNSFGIPSKNPIKIQTRNGRLNARYESVRLIRVFKRCNMENIAKSGSIRTIGGNICVPIIRNLETFPPGLYLARAYPPNAAIGIDINEEKKLQ